MTELKPQEFHQTIASLLSLKLQPFQKRGNESGKDLNLVTCVEIYTTIFETLVEVISEAGIDIGNEAMNYLAQQYYDGILINGNQELDPDIFTQRAKLSEISTEELTLLAVLLNGTDFALEVLQEIKHRS